MSVFPKVQSQLETVKPLKEAWAFSITFYQKDCGSTMFAQIDMNRTDFLGGCFI
jgi:hypothetical protein